MSERSAQDGDGERDDADERDGDPMMRSMRSVWLSMRDEEPPQGGLAELMAAARAKADVMAPKESWWQRVFATLRRPPVLAMATVVLLVGGAVIIGKRQSDMSIEQLAPAPTITRGPESNAALEPLDEPAAAPGAAPTVTAGSAQPGGDRGGAPAVRRPERKPQRDPIARPEPVQPPAAESERASLEVTDDAAGDAQKTGETAIATDEDVARPRSAPTPDVSRPATIAQLVARSAAAAARGDCATVKTTSVRIRKLSLAVYNEQIAKNAAIAKCLK